MADEDEVLDEGGLSAKKVVAGAALGVAVPAAVGVAKKLLSSGGDDDQDEPEQQDDDDASSEPTSRERSRSRSTSRPKTSTKRAAKTAKKTTQKVDRSNRTREQLYKQATRLKIEGRSSMNKSQLERAIQRATGK